ncbi:translin [Nematostella vectensis]|uniref:translin n=1 Tax=Nematostella vectensis TaxID=45351 RepID=UPI0020774481|nr:translin [Nematostella vectensis]
MAEDTSESGDNSISSIFGGIQQGFANEQREIEEIKILVGSLEKTAREILTVLQKVHQQPSKKVISDVCTKGREMFALAQRQYAELASKIQPEKYFRFYNHWMVVNQQFAFLASFLLYLESETLPTKKDVADLLNVKVTREEGFHLVLDDYLIGLLSLASEVSRFALNCVTAKYYGWPLKISAFLGELDAGFRLLNLKNDFLRKKYDGLKYDLKKVEEVVYDLSIRGYNLM